MPTWRSAFLKAVAPVKKLLVRQLVSLLDAVEDNILAKPSLRLPRTERKSVNGRGTCRRTTFECSRSLLRRCSVSKNLEDELETILFSKKISQRLNRKSNSYFE